MAAYTNTLPLAYLAILWFVKNRMNNHMLNTIEIIGWIGTILIVGAYFLNINGKIKSTAMPYIISNLCGGILFSIYTYAHRTWPNMVVNVIWVFIAIAALLKKK